MVNGGQDLVRQPPHLGEAGKIGQQNIDAVGAGLCGHQLACRFRTGGMSTCHDYAHASAREAERGMEADAGTGAGYESDPTFGHSYSHPPCFTRCRRRRCGWCPERPRIRRGRGQERSGRNWAARQAICSSLNSPISYSIWRGSRYSLAPPQAHALAADIVSVDELNPGSSRGTLNHIACDFSQHAGENAVRNVAIPVRR